jgi:hypothetical protein
MKNNPKAKWIKILLPFMAIPTENLTKKEWIVSIGKFFSLSIIYLVLAIAILYSIDKTGQEWLYGIGIPLLMLSPTCFCVGVYLLIRGGFCLIFHPAVFDKTEEVPTKEESGEKPADSMAMRDKIFQITPEEVDLPPKKWTL